VLLSCVLPNLVCTRTLSVLKISGRTPDQWCKKKEETKGNRTFFLNMNQEGNRTFQLKTFIYSSEIIEIRFIILIGDFFYTDIHNKFRCW
jgi:hypothetical protein